MNEQHEPIDVPDHVDASRLRFDEYHPLDHYLWEPRCAEFYGGPRIHVRYWWQFKGRMAVRSRTTCKLGRHKGGRTRFFASMTECQTCVFCSRRLTEETPFTVPPDYRGPGWRRMQGDA